jgi:hypothetical protein
MPHYYFNIYNDETTLDEEGRELPDLAAARELALDSARDLVCESVHKGHLNLDHRMERRSWFLPFATPSPSTENAGRQTATP